MNGTEYVGTTREQVKVVVRSDGSHYRAFNEKTKEQIGEAFMKFSDLSASLGLHMDGSRPQDLSDAAAVPERVKGETHLATTRDKVDVLVSWTGTHWEARNSKDERVGEPFIHLPSLAAALGLTMHGETKREPEIAGDQNDLAGAGEAPMRQPELDAKVEAGTAGAGPEEAPPGA